MLIEIERRRDYLQKQEQRATEIQKELDRAYEEEFRTRESFRQTWGIFLPPICPALDVRNFENNLTSVGDPRKGPRIPISI